MRQFTQEISARQRIIKTLNDVHLDKKLRNSYTEEELEGFRSPVTSAHRAKETFIKNYGLAFEIPTSYVVTAKVYPKDPRYVV